uniref:MI domain-containing protein n=1 Tax=Macrostomum lignano TaxID=282301 RepID=A0A1I8G5X0_9PLAT
QQQQQQRWKRSRSLTRSSAVSNCSGGDWTAADEAASGIREAALPGKRCHQSAISTGSGAHFLASNARCRSATPSSGQQKQQATRYAVGLSQFGGSSTALETQACHQQQQQQQQPQQLQRTPRSPAISLGTRSRWLSRQMRSVDRCVSANDILRDTVSPSPSNSPAPSPAPSSASASTFVDDRPRLRRTAGRASAASTVAAGTATTSQLQSAHKSTPTLKESFRRMFQSRRKSSLAKLESLPPPVAANCSATFEDENGDPCTDAYNGGYNHGGNRGGRPSYNNSYRGNGHRMQHHGNHQHHQQQGANANLPNNLPAQSYASSGNPVNPAPAMYYQAMQPGGVPVPIVHHPHAHQQHMIGAAPPGAPAMYYQQPPHAMYGAQPAYVPAAHQQHPAPMYAPHASHAGAYNIPPLASTQPQPLLPPPPQHQQQQQQQHQQQRHQQQQQQQSQQQANQQQPQQPDVTQKKILTFIDPRTNSAIELKPKQPTQPQQQQQPPQQQQQPQPQQQQQVTPQPQQQQQQQQSDAANNKGKQEQRYVVQKDMLAQVRSAKDGKTSPPNPEAANAGTVVKDEAGKTDTPVTEAESVKYEVGERLPKFDADMLRPAPTTLRSQSVDAVSVLHHSHSHNQLTSLAEAGNAGSAAAGADASSSGGAGAASKAPKYEFKPEKGESDKVTLERKKTYDRDFLLKLQDAQLSTQKPSTLPCDIPELLRKTEVKTDDPDTDRRQDIERSIRSILNKVTPQNFESCFQQLTKCDIGTEDGLKCCVDIMFEKATRETSYSSVFAEICKRLSFLKVNTDKTLPDKCITHRSLLLKKCQLMFETPLLDQMETKADYWDQIISKEEKEDKKKSLEEEKEEQVKKVKDQYYGNIRFIGELYMKGVLTANIIYSCITALLSCHQPSKSNSRGTLVESLECLCELLRTVGKKLETPTGNRKQNESTQLDASFGQIKKIIADKSIESKVRFKLIDVVEMRERGWELREMERRLQERPMTKEELEQKEREEEARRAMAASNIGGGGGGGGGRGGRGNYGRPPASPGNSALLPPTSADAEWTPVVANSRRQQKMDTRKLILDSGESSGIAGDASASGGLGGSGGSAPMRLGPSRPSISRARGAGAGAGAGRSPALQRLTGGVSGGAGGRRNNSRESSGSRGASREGSPHSTRDQQQPVQQSQLARQQTPGPAPKAVTALSAAPLVGMHRSMSTHELPSRLGASASATANILDKEALGRKSKNIMEEWLAGVISLDETKSCFQEIASHPHLKVFVDINAEHLLNANSKELREKGGRLFFELLDCRLIDIRTVIDGFSNLMENAEDMQSDFPLLGSYLGEIFSSFLQKSASYLDCVLRLVMLIPSDILCFAGGKKSPLRGEILSRAAHLASVRLGHERVGQDFRDAGVCWPTVLETSAESAAAFVTSKELEFTESPLPDPDSAASRLSFERLAGRVQEVVRAGLPEGDADKLAESVIDLLERGVARADRDCEAFNRELMRGVCGACLCAGQLDAGLLKRLCSVLQQFVEGFSQEIWSLKATAACLVDGSSVELLPEVFTVFLDNRLVSEESFKNWYDEHADGSQREATRTFVGTLESTATLHD